MLKWELKKLCTRFTVIFVLALLFLNIVTVYILYADEGTADGQLKREARAELIDTYNKDRDSYDAAYAVYEEQNAAFNDWMMNGEGSFTWNNSIIDLEDYGDRRLWNDVLAEINRSENYNTDIAKVLREAYTRLKEIGNRRGEYAYEYQVNVILRYEELADLQITAEDVCGWNEYFSLVSPVIFLTVALIGVSVQAFLLEKQARFTGILHVSRRGETGTRLAKIGALFVSSTVLTAVFTLSPLAVLYFTTGLSSGGQAIQALTDFEYCHAELTVFGYLCVCLLIRVVIFFILSLVTAVLGQLTGSFAITLGGMFCFLAANVFLPVGFFTAAFVNYYFERYRAVNFFGLHINAILFLGIVLGIVLLASFAGAMVLKINLREYRFLNSLKKILKKERNRTEKNKPLSVMHHTLFVWELKKIVLNPRAAALLAVLFAVRCWVQSGYFTPSMTENEVIYRSYICDLAEFGGAVDDATDAYIAEEGNYISSVTEEYNTALVQFKANEIDSKQLHEISTRYNYAQSVAEAYGELCMQQSYLKSMAEDYENIGYTDEAGVEKFLFPQFDVVFAALLLLLLSDVFAAEHQSGFAPVLRLTKRGRRDTLRAKYSAAIASVCLIWLIFTAADCVLLWQRFDMNGLGFGMMSIEDFREIGWNLPIGIYMLLCKTAGLCGAMLITALAVGLSEITASTVKCVTVLFLVLLAPYLLSVFGMTLFDGINAAYILAPAAAPDGWVRYAIFVIAAAVVTEIACRKWVGAVRKK